MEMNSPMDITDAAELFELASVQQTSDVRKFIVIFL